MLKGLLSLFAYLPNYRRKKRKKKKKVGIDYFQADRNIEI